MNNLFESVTDNELKNIYKDIQSAKEEGLRPRILDSYIKKIREIYPLDIGEGWKFTEQLFFEEVARRYFA